MSIRRFSQMVLIVIHRLEPTSSEVKIAFIIAQKEIM